MLDEKRIREAIAKATEMGWRLSEGVTVNSKLRTCCPMGAVLVAEGASNDPMLGQAAETLGISSNEAILFACGFDGDLAEDNDSDAYKLGAQFRREFLAPGGAR